MDIHEFIEMVKAIEEDRPFSVGFQLQWSNCGDLTLQHLTSIIHPKSLRLFLEKIEQAQAPSYD